METWEPAPSMWWSPCPETSAPSFLCSAFLIVPDTRTWSSWARCSGLVKTRAGFSGSRHLLGRSFMWAGVGARNLPAAKKFSGKPLVFQKYFSNENKNNRSFWVFDILFPIVSPQDTCPGCWRLIYQWILGPSKAPFWFFIIAVMTSSSLHFVSIDLGLAFPKLAKFFFGGHFFLPAALKLPIITGLSDYPKLWTLAPCSRQE